MPIIRNFPTRNVVNESDENPIQSSRRISKKLDLLDQKMDGLYRNIYITRPDNKKNLEDILNQLDDAIDAIQQNDVSVAGMSELLRRLDNSSGTNVDRYLNSVGELFNDQNLINTLFANNDMHKYIAAQNFQFDMICRYLPKLLDALEIKRDNVLSSDNFSKEFINPKSSRTNKLELERFSSNTIKLEKEYEITKFLEKTYMNVSKYGEDFIYIIPYNVAFERIIRRTNYRKNNARLGQVSFYESSQVKTKQSEVCLESNFVDSKEFKEYQKTVKESYGSVDLPNQFKGNNVTLHFNDLNVIPELVNERVVLSSRQEMERFQSLASLYEANSLSADMEAQTKRSNKLLHNTTATDGLIIPGELKRDPDKIDKNMLGAVIERLPRENVIPVYIGKKICTFRGEDITLNITNLDFSREDENITVILDTQHAELILGGILRVLNYNYGRNNNTEEGSEEITSSNSTKRYL